MNITFRQASVEDCKILRLWIKTNEFVRRWYYFDKTPRLATLEKEIGQLFPSEMFKKVTKNQPIWLVIVLCVELAFHRF